VGTSKDISTAITKHFGPALVRNWQKIWLKAEQLTEEIQPERHTEPSPSVLIPLVDAASRESRDELQDLWAALLANSMLDGGDRVRRDFIEAVAKFEPIDAAVLKIISGVPNPRGWLEFRDLNRAYIVGERRSHCLSEQDTWEISCRALVDLGCISSAPGVGNAAAEYPVLTPFGRQLLRASMVS
jgi:hypothetical protein